MFRNADLEVLQKLLDYMTEQAAAMEDYIMEREFWSRVMFTVRSFGPVILAKFLRW